MGGRSEDQDVIGDGFMCFAHEVFLAEVLPGYFVQYVDDESVPTSGWRPSFYMEIVGEATALKDAMVQSMK